MSPGECPRCGPLESQNVRLRAALQTLRGQVQNVLALIDAERVEPTMPHRHLIQTVEGRLSIAVETSVEG